MGIPNVGKSSFFNALTKVSVPAENFPFCTIDPNVAKVAVPDKRFKFLCSAFKPKSQVPAVLTVTDIAGLVRGASEGAGLGNAFLSHIRAVDAIFHMTRAFEDKDVTHVEDSVDPVRDMEIIQGELCAKDLQVRRPAPQPPQVDQGAALPLSNFSCSRLLSLTTKIGVSSVRDGGHREGGGACKEGARELVQDAGVLHLRLREVPEIPRRGPGSSTSNFSVHTQSEVPCGVHTQPVLARAVHL